MKCIRFHFTNEKYEVNIFLIRQKKIRTSGNVNDKCHFELKGENLVKISTGNLSVIMFPSL